MTQVKWGFMQFKADPEKVWREIQQIGDQYTPQDVLEYARDPQTELHKCFDWDDTTAQGFKDALENNAPCITTFGLKKSFEQAVVRNNIDKYSTKFQNSVNIIAPSGLVPITFAKHTVVEKLIAAKKGSPVLSRQNVFAGWSATFDIQFVDGGEYSLDQILQIIGLAGFGGGIGSGRSSGYGRYHIEGVTA